MDRFPPVCTGDRRYCVAELHPSGEDMSEAGRRPALVLSPSAYNRRTGLMVCCPMITQVKSYPFEILIAGTPPSAALADQVKGLAWRSRRATRKSAVSPAQLAAVGARIVVLIGGKSTLANPRGDAPGHKFISRPVNAFRAPTPPARSLLGYSRRR